MGVMGWGAPKGGSEEGVASGQVGGPKPGVLSADRSKAEARVSC